MIFGEEDSGPMANQPNPGGNQKQQEVRIDASRMETVYCNMYAISAAPDEVTLFIGANSMMPNANVPIAILSHRVVLQPANAKRLMLALQQTVAAHEKNFGPIEIAPPQRG